MSEITEMVIVSSVTREILVMGDFKYIYLPITMDEAAALGYGHIQAPCVRIRVK